MGVAFIQYQSSEAKVQEMVFRPATREKSKLRMAIDGVSGSGKTFTALRLAVGLGKRIAVINTESGAVEKYLGLSPDGTPFQFDVCELDDFAPTRYTESILAAGAAGYDVLIIDSLSHAWAGSGGALELKDRKGGNSFTAWKDITPMHNAMIEAILRSPCHVIATMRSKTEYVLEPDGRGMMVPRKMGMAPIQRAGMEYEFDLYCSIDSEHIMRVSKSRCPEVADMVTVKPGLSFIAPVVAWLNDGSDAPAERFAVTEADLKNMAKYEASQVPPAPKKTAQELMQEAADRYAAEHPEEAAATDPAEELCQGGTSQDGVVRARGDDPATDEQVAAIKRALTAWEQTKPGVTAEFIGRLNGAGWSKIAEMTFDQARDLLTAIDAQEMSDFFDSLLSTAAAG